ncbi:FeoB-associated Cys-rich membrane protein [Anaerobium acetethylicum]|uniref:Virus attachment protein p12 family protein n=1 Tax=Anaerobium acetethylicum TaxID=1619234 RepID=A0A1D3TVD5_9FIRM|nr:FeoB-associated Cys-rich membrane protein [Anaerobium acetethylicum]SCP98092.1 Virus attachment protein p12 family protein [Anaerobium acetethylicum]
MDVTIGLAVLITVYAGFVIIKKIKDIKKGKFCSCNCDSCPSKNCGKKGKDV